MTGLRSVLIANRGEIACRIIRTARRLGLRTVAVYSEADRAAQHVALADEAHPIGPAPAAESYLRIDRLLDAARRAGADCIHPGYGFLSERPDFAEACAQAGIVFVGPPAAAIRAMGLKDAAKALVARAGVPVVPGYHGPRQEPDFLAAQAAAIGYPVLIKAVAGGGGKGMRRVEAPEAFSAALEGAQREALGAFGDPRVLVEKYVLSPRHVEIQVFCDAHGNALHLFERDCSLQRRHQKVIEEAPAPGMPPEMRAAMGRAAVEAARAVGYVGAGTVEFIADGREGLRPDGFWFMEMNTRLQVEHPVTEAITGLDLVEWQFRVAAGEPLPLGQDDLAIDGHAVEARLYAEDPAGGFLPSTGRLRALALPSGEGLRVDAGVREGDTVSPFYDPMIAKVIAHGATRGEALDRLAAALDRTLVAGPKTNVAFLRALALAPDFRAGRFDTGFIDRHLDALTGRGAGIDPGAIRQGVAALLARERIAPASPPSPWDLADGFQLGAGRRQAFPILVEGEAHEVVLAWPEGGGALTIEVGGEARAQDRAHVVPGERGVLVVAGGRQVALAPPDPFDVDLDHIGEGGSVKAPMHGRLVALFVAPGDRVTRGQRLAIVEAMKMEHALTAPSDGEVTEVTAQAGAQVAEGARLIGIRPDADGETNAAGPEEPA
ncbi:Carbamoyl-phosphate synthase L chain ATP-binding [Methylobacterium sp. 4-46]|uniref:acetyl-CoA carboxylase biotin carboxylase subunit n=1 Tax=unclassified Methylobacterium TaxID=2615210 RepID=UPI000152D70E|nr:acetyl/propionyl/methylcrotonyl-CoA carboxylase subunit alpha [Methylobacterium nodulans]ACA16776.1 Carbamoyl-phosphate synthase L chain ATP-binding [Methylobacterium sp. 4-46]WFT82472.1 acetyl/propionyl/methylcrotonyl-CoA carboxylase subunit alpha [Methylobacterium nodulans]